MPSTSENLVFDLKKVAVLKNPFKKVKMAPLVSYD
jgi:hypothetical protein